MGDVNIEENPLIDDEDIKMPIPPPPILNE
jgi:hypothetical protein